MEYYYKHLDIAKEVGDKLGEGTSRYSLGRVFEFLGSFHEAVDYYQSSVKVWDNMRSLLQSEDTWKISFRDLHRSAYTSLWRVLLKLQKTKEALCAAEQGRAQALADGLRIQYGFPAPSPGTLEPTETISYISNEISTKTIFVALQPNTINFWVLSKGHEISLRQTKIERDNALEDPLTDLLESALKNIGAGVGVRCENRSLDELRDDPLSTRGGDQEVAELSPCIIDSLQPLYDTIIGPIADLLQDDELIIVPDGPLCLAPLCALSESIRIRTVPSLTSLKLIADCPEDYHGRRGVLLVGNPCLDKITM